MRHALVKPLVKTQRMASRARRREFHRCHQFTPTCRRRPRQPFRLHRNHLIRRRITRTTRDVLRVPILPFRRSRRPARLVTIPASQLYIRPVRPRPNRLHMNRVIHSNRPRITRLITQHRKLRMPILKTLDMGCVARTRPAASLQISVALRATLILRRDNIHSPAMLRMATRATKGIRLRSVMHRAVVTSQTSRIASLRRKRSRRPHMARRALRFQHRVCRTHPPARIHARVPRKSVPSNPNQHKRRQPHAKPKFRALQPRRPLEIIQVDPLRQFLSCSCSRHSPLVTRHFFSSEAKVL